MMGQYQSGGSAQMQRSANMSSLQSPRPHSSRDEMSEYEDMQRDPRNSFIPEIWRKIGLCFFGSNHILGLQALCDQ
jgi:hypothetical protein